MGLGSHRRARKGGRGCAIIFCWSSRFSVFLEEIEFKFERVTGASPKALYPYPSAIIRC
jgi:hypothetical protein